MTPMRIGGVLTLYICLHYVTGTHWECLDNCLFVSIMSLVLIGSVSTIVFLSLLCHGYSLGVSCQGYICHQYVMGTHLKCLDNCLFVSIMSWVLIGSDLTIVYLSPLCHGYSFWGSCQSSICLQYVMCTHWSVLSIHYLSPVCHGYSLECLVNPLFVSSMSWVLIGSVLTIVNLSPVCHGYSLDCLVNPLFVSIVSWVLIGVSCQSSICLHCVMGTHWSVLTILYLSPLCHGYSLGVSFQSSICLQYVMGTHWGVLTILYLSPLCHGYSLECLVNPLFVSSMSWVLIGVS